MKNWTFDSQFTSKLPGDLNRDSQTRQVFQSCYSFVQPTPVKSPQLVAYSREMAETLGLSDLDCQSELFTNVFSGNKLLPGMQPYAMRYGGHQFGQWAGQLGDGRAINLGEAIGNDQQFWTLQLKGAGTTQYSRFADGRAVLRSSIREFLCSEAMFHLRIPTTRALSIVLTGEEVLRDMFYDGNPKMEPGAIVCRVAPSFIRFGNFEIHSSCQEMDVLKSLLDFTIRTSFPHLGEPSLEVYLSWFNEVCQKTADMIVHWQRVGFVHGVMNTDNMSILGLTIDYGPYGWLEDYDLTWTPNTTDAHGRRYCFGQQPQIAIWNLLQLANAIHPLIGKSTVLEEILNESSCYLQGKMQLMLVQKLGFSEWKQSSHLELTNELSEVLHLLETDMTIFYRNLAQIKLDCSLDLKDDEFMGPLFEAYYIPGQITTSIKKRTIAWLKLYQSCVRKDEISENMRREKMNQVNPKYVLRNYLAQLAIEKAELGDFSMVHELLEVLRHPYQEQSGQEKYCQKRPDWARHKAGCSMLSCSS